MADITSFPIHTTELANVGSLQDASQLNLLGVENNSVVQTQGLGVINYQMCQGTIVSDEISNVLCVSDDSSDVYQTDPKDVVNMGFTNGARPTWMASPISVQSYALSANTTYTFSVENSTKAVAFLTGANKNNMIITLVNTTGSGTVTTVQFADSSAASPVSLTSGGTRKLTITMNSNASQICFLVFMGSVTKD